MISLFKLNFLINKFNDLQNKKRIKLFKFSNFIIIYLTIVNILSLIVSIILVFILVIFNNEQQSKYILNILMIIISLSVVCLFSNVIALFGLQTWNRKLLLPWLFLYAFFIFYMFGLVFYIFYMKSFNLENSIRFIISVICLFFYPLSWRNISRQYIDMKNNKPDDVIENIELNIQSKYVEDTPPKYEDLEL